MYAYTMYTIKNVCIVGMCWVVRVISNLLRKYVQVSVFKYFKRQFRLNTEEEGIRNAYTSKRSMIPGKMWFASKDTTDLIFFHKVPIWHQKTIYVNTSRRVVLFN